ncbi:hypothetical protein HDU97_003981 [Phlyctochytrium planicorne]|nr:hypothetical protein HDU97_003981 [Phlyctochytrium planicorne]
MSFFWREAGLTYLQVANIAASALRRIVKEEVRVIALKREDQSLKMARWTDGKQGETKLLFKEASH